MSQIPLHHSHDRAAHPLTIHQQNDRYGKGTGHRIGTGLIAKPQAVVIPHHAFHHTDCADAAVSLIQLPEFFSRQKKRIQIITWHPQHPGMKSGIYIIGSTFEGAGPDLTTRQRPQQAAGKGCLAAAAACAGYQDTAAHTWSPSRTTQPLPRAAKTITGFSAVII